MIRTIVGALATLIVVSISGCQTGNVGWVTDSEQYWRLSGFEVKAPSGPNWYKTEGNEQYPNAIIFENLERAPYGSFTITFARAFGAPINRPLSGDVTVEDGLRQLLTPYAEKAGIVLQEANFDSSLGAPCWKFEGNLEEPDLKTPRGVVRVESVTGFLCAHPGYPDFLVGMEALNGSSVGSDPANRKHQTDHFFRSIRFTPRSLPAKPEKRSIDEGKALRG